MPEQRFEISQDREILDMIDSSLFRCGRSGLPDFEGSLPAVTAEGRARSRRAISGHTMLIRESRRSTTSSSPRRSYRMRPAFLRLSRFLRLRPLRE